jgi:hypothetical protein
MSLDHLAELGHELAKTGGFVVPLGWTHERFDRGSMDNTMTTVRVASPSGARSVALTHTGEVRFGPPYYTLAVLDFDFPWPQDVLVAEARWRPDERGLAVVVIQSVDASRPPDCELVLLDVAAKVQCTVVRASLLMQIVAVSDEGCTVMIGTSIRTFTWSG